MSLPPDDLGAWKDRYKGQKLAILANGASLNDHDLASISFPTMGLNASWSRHWSTLHCAADHKQAEMAPSLYRRAEVAGTLPAGCKGPDVFAALVKEGRFWCWGTWPEKWRGHTVQTTCKDLRPGRQTPVPFSLDIREGVQLGMAGTGSVAYMGLQIAAFMGFNPIYFIGLDLGGEHFHGQWKVNPDALLKQNEMFSWARRALDPLGVKVWNVQGSVKSLCDQFPMVTFGGMISA